MRWAEEGGRPRWGVQQGLDQGHLVCQPKSIEFYLTGGGALCGGLWIRASAGLQRSEGTARWDSETAGRRGRGLAEPWSREVVFDKVLGPQSLLFLVLQNPVEYKVPFPEVLGVGAEPGMGRTQNVAFLPRTHILRPPRPAFPCGLHLLPFALKSHSVLETYCILIKLPEWEAYEETHLCFLLCNKPRLSVL